MSYLIIPPLIRIIENYTNKGMKEPTALGSPSDERNLFFSHSSSHSGKALESGKGSCKSQ